MMATAVSAQELNRAGLVVVLSDGEVLTRCVAFAEDEISGYEAMSRSGLAFETAVEAMGTNICSVESVGCPADDCFCQCQGGGDCIYWSYWHLQEGEWNYSNAGASSYRMRNGAVNGWVWGPGTPNQAIEPPLLTLDEICAEPNASNVVNDEDEMMNDEASPSWIGYALFGVILVGLGGVLAMRRKG